MQASVCSCEAAAQMGAARAACASWLRRRAALTWRQLSSSAQLSASSAQPAVQLLLQVLQQPGDLAAEDLGGELTNLLGRRHGRRDRQAVPHLLTGSRRAGGGVS